LEKIPYVDHPEIKVDEHESTQMPFRYVTDAKGQGIFPEVSFLAIPIDTRQALIITRA